MMTPLYLALCFTRYYQLLADRDLQAYDMVNRRLNHTIIHVETVHKNNNVYIWCYIGGRLLIAVKDLNVCNIQYVDNGLSFLSSPN